GVSGTQATAADAGRMDVAVTTYGDATYGDAPGDGLGVGDASFAGPNKEAWASTICDWEGGAPAPLQRTGCPALPPGPADCAPEGLYCLYAAADGGTSCFVVRECVYGIWSFRSDACAYGADSLANDQRCPNGVPVYDSPCQPESLQCSYLQCWTG